MGIMNLKVYEEKAYREPTKEELELMADGVKRFHFNNDNHLCNSCGMDTFFACPKILKKGDKFLEDFSFIEAGMEYDLERYGNGGRIEIEPNQVVVTECKRYKR